MSLERVLLIIWLVLTFLLVATFCLPAPAQIVTYTPQGAEVLSALLGRAVPGIAVIDVQICSTKDERIPAGRVYQTAVAVGYEPRSPLVIDALMSQELGRNWRRILASSLNIGTHSGAALISSGTIAAPASWITGLILAGQTLDTIADRLRARLPSASWRRDLLEGDLDLAAGKCQNRLMFARYHSDILARTADLAAPPDVDVPFKPERRR